MNQTEQKAVDTVKQAVAIAAENALKNDIIPYWQRMRFCYSAGSGAYYASFKGACSAVKRSIWGGFLELLEGLICGVVLLVLSLPLLLWRCVLQPWYLAHFKGPLVSDAMKSSVQAAIKAAGIAALFILSACAPRPLTPQERQALTDGETILIYGAIGYATGGEAGAIAGATGQAVTNLQRIQNQRTAAKNPGGKTNSLASPVLPQQGSNLSAPARSR